MLGAATPFGRFMAKLKEFGLEPFGRFYGTYRAKVMKNHGVKDGDSGMGLIRVSVPAFGDDETTDRVAYPMMWRVAGHGGEFYPPEEGDMVYVVCEGGNPQYPLYMGGWFGKSDVPEDFKKSPPTTRGYVSPAGHAILFDDDDSEKKVTLRWRDGQKEGYIQWDKDGNLVVETDSGVKITLTDNPGVSKGFTVEDGTNKVEATPLKMTVSHLSEKIEMSAGQLVLDASAILKLKATQVQIAAQDFQFGGSEPAAKGRSLIQLLAEMAALCASMTMPVAGTVAGPPVTAASFVKIASQLPGTLNPRFRF